LEVVEGEEQSDDEVDELPCIEMTLLPNIARPPSTSSG